MRRPKLARRQAVDQAGMGAEIDAGFGDRRRGPYIGADGDDNARRAGGRMRSP